MKDMHIFPGSHREILQNTSRNRMADVQVREKVKTGVLIGLLLLSLVQVGIHWRRQAQGRPLRFFTGWFQDNGAVSVDEQQLASRKSDYILPARIAVSDEMSFRWELDPAGETWRTGWNDLRDTYLPLLVSRSPDRKLQRETWAQLLTTRRVFLFEFGSPVPAAILPWLTNTEAGRRGLAGESFREIEKIAVAASENVNSTENTLYVLASDAVYRYTLTVPQQALPKSWYVLDQAVLTSSGNQPMSQPAAQYGLKTVRSDVLVLDDQIAAERPYYEASLPASVPAEFRADNLPPLQEGLLLNRKDSLLARIGEETGEVTFSDTENTYRINRLGQFAYRYLPGAADAGTDMEAAFRQAVSFLDSRRGLLGDARLVLDSVTPVQPKGTALAEAAAVESVTPIAGFSAITGRGDETARQDEGAGTGTAASTADKALAYTFTFTYRVDGHSFLMANSGAAGLNAPVSVTAVADRVIACDWTIRQFTPVRAASWNVLFFDMYTEALDLFPDLANETLVLDGIRDGYVFSDGETTQTLAPEWLLASGGRTLRFPMRGGEVP